MTDPANTPVVDEPKAETPPSEPTAAAPTPSTGPATPPADDFDKERAMATIKAQREAEDKLKAELKEAKKAQAKLEEIENEKKSELERTTEERDRLKAESETAAARLRDANLQLALVKPDLGIVDPETAATLLKERGLTFADDGSPENLTEAVTALLEAKPFLKGNTSPPKPNVPEIDAGAGQGNGPAPNLTAEELEFAKTMNQDPLLFAELKRLREEKGSITIEDYNGAVERVNAAGA